MLPILVGISRAIISDMKSSSSLYERLYLIAIAVPSVYVFVAFFRCTV